MSTNCSNCGVAVDDPDVPCPVCGEDTFSDESLATGRDRFAAAFAYFALVPAITFLLLARFKNNEFVRFHCFQSIFLVAGTVLLAGFLGILFGILSVLPFLISALIVTIISLACFVLWVVLLVKALQGQRMRLPWIGKLAENKASS